MTNEAAHHGGVALEDGGDVMAPDTDRHDRSAVLFLDVGRDVLALPSDAEDFQFILRAAADDAAVVVARPDFVEVGAERVGFPALRVSLFELKAAPGRFRSAVRTDDAHLVVFVQFARHPETAAVHAGLVVEPECVKFFERHNVLPERFV